MYKYLITGFGGFVSNYFVKYLELINENCEVLGVSKTDYADLVHLYPGLNVRFQKVDLTNASEVKEVLSSFKPDYIIHLASFSSVHNSWTYPSESFINNTNVFLNIVDNVRLLKINPVILSVGSSEQYGVVRKEHLPINEDCPLNPISPYAVARVSQEMLSKIYADSYGIKLIITRSFNHIGVNQKPGFAIPSFVLKLLHAKQNNLDFIEVGDINIIRDFLDVEDVVRAYYALIKNGKNGSIYNVCSGKGYSIKQVLDKISEIVGYRVNYKTNPELIRPSDNPVIIGDNSKITNDINWQPMITLEESLNKIVESLKIEKDTNH